MPTTSDFILILILYENNDRVKKNCVFKDDHRNKKNIIKKKLKKKVKDKQIWK